MAKDIDLLAIQALMDMLTGARLPDEMRMSHQPQLNSKTAFSVIWYLQEYLGVLPDRFEQCVTCDGLFDMDTGGYVVDGTDVPDEWQERLGITREMLKNNDGERFCSCECESEHWNNLKEPG